MLLPMPRLVPGKTKDQSGFLRPAPAGYDEVLMGRNPACSLYMFGLVLAIAAAELVVVASIVAAEVEEPAGLGQFEAEAPVAGSEERTVLGTFAVVERKVAVIQVEEL
jgi:hypothetical protein